MINANEVTWDDQVPDDNGITWDEPSQNASLSPNEITWDENPDAGLGVVGRTAKAGRQFAQSIGKGAGNAMLGLATQIENAPLMPAPYQTPGMLRDIRSTESGRQYYEDVKAGKLIGKNPISEGLRTGSEAYQVEEGRPLGFFSDVTKGIAEFIPSMALSAVNPVMGTAATFEQLTGSKYEQYINEGKDEKTAFDAATLSALLNTPVEQAGNLLQIGKIAKLLDTKALSGVGTGFKKYLKTIFENALTEGGEELVQQQFDIIADQYANNPDADPVELGKNVWNQFASMKNVGESGKAFAGGFAGGLLMTGAASGAGVAQEIINEKGWIGADNKPIDILEPPTLPKKYELNAEQIDTLKKGYESGDITDDNLNAIILDKNTPPDIVKAINQMRVQKQSQNQPIDILKPKETVQGFDTSWPVNKSAEESAGVFTRQETQDEEGQRIMSNLNPENMERLKIQYAQKDPYLVDIAMRMFNGEQFDLKDMDKQDLRSLTILVGEDVINSQNGEMPIPTREGRGLITTGLQTTPQEPVIEQQRALPPPPADIGPEGEGQFAPPRRGPVAQGTGPVIPMGQLAKGDNPKNYSGDELRQIAKDNNLEIPKNMLKKTDMINFIKQGVQGNDQGIRENERQLPEGRIEQEGGAGESGENLELETSGEPGGTKEEIDQAAHEAATSPLNDIPEPTEAQKEAGNYKKGHVNLQGLDISIENPKGSTRSGVSKQGKKWSIEMQHHYGYIKSTEGKDHDQVDVFIGGNPESDKVFIVNQINPTNQKFDEHKVLIGFKDEESAKQAYLSNYEKGWKGMGSIAPMSMDEFKTWVKEGDQKKPVNVPRVTKETPIKVQRSSDEAGENTLYEVIEGPQKGSSISRGAITQAPEKYAIDESLMPSVAKKAEVDVNEAMAKELEKAKAKKTQQVTSIPKNKYDVYSTDVNGKTMYSYRDNMENDKGFGDPLFDTEEKAKTEAEIYKNVEAKNAESRRKVLEVEAGKSAKLDAEKAQREDLNGFGKDLDRMRKGKVVKTLNGKRNFDGKIMTIKEKIKELVDNNAEIFTREEDVIQPMSRRQYNNATQQEQDAHERRMKEAGKKTVYYVGGYNLGKTAYDYANHLKSLTSPKPEAKAVNPTELTESGVKTKEQVHDYSIQNKKVFFSITDKQKQALKSVTKADIHKAFPGSRVIPYKIEVDGQEHDGFLVTLSSGQNVAISPSQDFISIPNIEEVAKEYGISPSELKKKLSTGDKRIRGAFTPDVAESTSLIELLSTSDPGDLSHEKFHFLFGLLNKSDRGKIFTRYKTEEKAAEAFRKREGFTKTFWEKIQRILERIKDFIFGDSFKPVFEQLQGQVETGGKKFNIEDNISEIDDDKYLELAKDPEKNREELQKMVNNAAIRAGYDPSIEYRMQHQAPDSVSGIRLDKAMEDETVPKDYWERPDYYQYSGDEYSSFYKIKKAIELQKQYDSEGEGKKSRIWVYRAVPKNIKDENFRNGDWITPSREYARSEGKQIPEGYKVIAKKVDITDVYWDVNSINEMGYDDGKNYAYKNTKNNRKLLDPVIYSPSGAFIIPLSKRFNFREYSTKYSIEDVKTKQKSVSQLNTYDEIMDYLTNKNASTPEIRKESKLAKRTEADTIEAKLAEEFGDLVEYKTRPEFMKDQAAKAEDLLNSNYEKAKKIAMGEIDPPGDLRIATVYEAVKLRALNDNDIDLLYDLGTASKVPTRLSEYGQAIKAADSSIIEDPVKAMQDIEKDRKNKLKKKGKKAVSIEEVRKLKAKLAEAEKKLSEYESKTDDKKSEAEIDRLIDSSPRKSYKKINQSDITSKIKTAIDSNQELSDISTDIQELAKYFITQGMVTRGALVKAVYDVLKAGPMPDITLRETMDAISGYGKWKPLSKDAVLIKLRDLKGQMQQVAKLEDMQRGMAPLKTGIERRTPTDEERRLIKQVEEMKKELGIEVIDPEKQLKSALDSVKTRLSNQIRDLEYQIESGEKIVKKKTGLKYDVEAEKLKKRRDELKQEFDNLFGKPKISDEQRIQMAIKAVERSIIEYTRKINENDLTPLAKRNPLQSKELEALRAERDELKAKVKELRDLAKPKRSPEEISLQRLKTRLKNETEKLTEKLKGLELVKTERKETVYDAEARKLKEVRDNIKQAFNSAVEARGAVTKEEADRLIELSRAMAAARKEMEEGGDRFKYGAAKVAFLRYIDYLKGSDASIKTLLKDEWAEVKAAWKDNKASAFTKSGKDIIQTISDLSISLMASLDNSFMGRQGLNTLLTHPTVWAPAAKKSFVDIYQTIISKHGGNMVRDAAMADAYSRPNYVSGDYDTAKLIPKTEEQFPTSIPERIPLIGRAFKASENAFLNSGVRMRINTYDLLKRIAEAQDVKIDKEWIQETGKLINSITARGDLGKMGQGGPLRLIFWAPKMLWGNINVLTAHFGGAGLKTPFARQQARINLAKIIGFTVLAAAIADGLGEMFGKKDTVEWNPISSDFMKIKVGNTRFDLTAGKGSIITLMARAATFKTKSTRTKKVGKLNSGRYGSKTLFDVMIDFMANKSAPVTKTAIDIARGRNFNYEKPGIGNTAYNLVTPIGVQNFIETYQRDNKDIPTEEIIGNVLDMVGINASTYDSNAEQRKKYRELRKAD